MTSQPDKGRQDAQRITAALWSLIKSRGRGSVMEVEKALGYSKHLLRQHRRRGFSLEETMRILAILDHPPGAFFASVFGDGPTTAGDRFRADGSDLIARGIIDVPELASPTRPDVLTDIELDALDRARFEDPRVAVDQGRGLAFLAAFEGRQGDAAACAARWGSALRASEQWHQAHAVVCWAINHAPEGPLLADCWLRAASVTSDYGEFADAAELARVAMLAFVEMGDDTGTGKALASRGLFLRRGGEYRDAIRCLRSALAKLPKDEQVNQFACHFELAAASLALGRFEATERYIASAKMIAPAAGTVHLLWIRARFAARRKDYARAAHLYERTAVALARSPVDTALVGVELARVYLQSRRPVEAIETAEALATLAMPWRANRLVSAAIRDLWCSARQGEMTIRMLDRIAGRIQRVRDRRAVALGPRLA